MLNDYVLSHDSDQYRVTTAVICVLDFRGLIRRTDPIQSLIRQAKDLTQIPG